MAKRYPVEIQQAIERFKIVIPAWAAASRLELADVEHEIVVAFLSGTDPLREVPRALGVRKAGGVWRPTDAMPASFFLSDRDVAMVDEEEQLGEDFSGLALALLGGSEAVAARCGVGRRAAQLRIAAQAERFAVAGDLFAGGK